MASNPYAPYSSENELWKAADDASVKYLKLLDSYEKSKTRTDLGSIPTKAEVEKAKEEKERLALQYERLMLDMKRPKYPPVYKSSYVYHDGKDYFYGGKKRRSRTTRRMRMKKTKRTRRTRQTRRR